MSGTPRWLARDWSNACRARISQNFSRRLEVEIGGSFSRASAEGEGNCHWVQATRSCKDGLGPRGVKKEQRESVAESNNGASEKELIQRGHRGSHKEERNCSGDQERP